jgi:hypothetical protein
MRKITISFNISVSFSFLLLSLFKHGSIVTWYPSSLEWCSTVCWSCQGSWHWSILDNIQEGEGSEEPASTMGRRGRLAPARYNTTLSTLLTVSFYGIDRIRGG